MIRSDCCTEVGHCPWNRSFSSFSRARFYDWHKFSIEFGLYLKRFIQSLKDNGLRLTLMSREYGSSRLFSVGAELVQADVVVDPYFGRRSVEEVIRWQTSQVESSFTSLVVLLLSSQQPMSSNNGRIVELIGKED
ncbi:hypothetical protein AKJ16_DCAP04508 [Drosera capensis]